MSLLVGEAPQDPTEASLLSWHDDGLIVPAGTLKVKGGREFEAGAPARRPRERGSEGGPWRNKKSSQRDPN